MNKIIDKLGYSYGDAPLQNAPADTIRGGILKEAERLTNHDREKVYGDTLTNMSAFVALLNARFSTNFTPEDGALIMVLAKIARIREGNYHEDNYIDAAAYIAMAGECRKRLEIIKNK